MPDRASRSFETMTLLCLAGAILLWGTSFVAMKVALTGFPPMAVVFLRMAIGSLLFLPLWFRMPKQDYRRGDWKWLLLVALFEPCFYFLFEGYAIRLTTASQAGVISALVPLLVVVGAKMFLGEEMSMRAGLGLALSLGGVALLSLGGHSAEAAPNPALGNTLELLAMVCAAGYMVVLKHLCSRFQPWFLTGVMNLIGAAFFLPGAILSNPSTWLAAPAKAWLGAAYLGCFVTLGAFGLYNVAVSRMPAGRAAMSINLIPFVAVASGWLVLGESLAPLQILGGAIIGFGVFLGETGPRAEPIEELAAEEA